MVEEWRRKFQKIHRRETQHTKVLARKADILVGKVDILMPDAYILVCKVDILACISRKKRNFDTNFDTYE